MSVPKEGETTWLWLLKIISGVLVIVLLLIHLTVNHFIGPQSLLTYPEVVAYLSRPGIALMEMSFLVFVVSHALLGTRSIILDFNPARSVLTAVNWLFTIIGVGSIVYGIWLILTILSKG